MKMIRKIKGYFLFLLIFTPAAAFTQNWVSYDIDSVLKLEIPSNYSEEDTLGQHVVVANINNGVVVINSTPLSDKQWSVVTDERELKEFYNGFRIGLLQQVNGELVESHFARQNGLLLIQYSMTIKIDSSEQAKHCVGVLIHGKMYSVFFTEIISKSRELTEQRNRLYNSIKVNPKLLPGDQLHTSGTSVLTQYKAGYALGYLIAFGIVVLLVGGLVFLILKLTKAI
ncbi:MAG: hypothetical protein ACJ77K_15195 [Bacteroidia bacterium]